MSHRIDISSQQTTGSLNWAFCGLLVVATAMALPSAKAAEFIKQKVLTDADRQGLIRHAFLKRVRIENKVKVQEVLQSSCCQ